MNPYREAGAGAPTAYGIGLLDELRTVANVGGTAEVKEARLAEVLRRRRSEVTVSLALLLRPGDFVGYVMNNELLGMSYNKDTEKPEIDHAPLHPLITLQSLRKHCSRCESGECGRVGQFHDIVYKTSTKSGSGYEHNLLQAMGGVRENNVRCEVDPETGEFQLPPLEAIKCLRQFGERIVRKRWKDKERQKGDRWLVREPRHHELYWLANLSSTNNDVSPAAARSDVPAMDVE